LGRRTGENDSIKILAYHEKLTLAAERKRSVRREKALKWSQKLSRIEITYESLPKTKTFGKKRAETQRSKNNDRFKNLLQKKTGGSK